MLTVASSMGDDDFTVEVVHNNDDAVGFMVKGTDFELSYLVGQDVSEGGGGDGVERRGYTLDFNFAGNFERVIAKEQRNSLFLAGGQR